MTITEPDPDGSGPQPAPVSQYDSDADGRLIRFTQFYTGGGGQDAGTGGSPVDELVR